MSLQEFMTLNLQTWPQDSLQSQIKETADSMAGLVIGVLPKIAYRKSTNCVQILTENANSTQVLLQY